jgi:uncharacterized LabA/DUF88 family protein
VINEKGSDVNLGAYLVRDAFLHLYDVAVIISNDADFIQPVTIVHEELSKQV